METSNFFIYGLRDPNTLEIRYIGLTSRGLKRPQHHSCKSALKFEKCHRSSWIKSLNGKKPIIEVLEYCKNKELLNDLEIKWIKFAQLENWNLTNHTPGGYGTKNYKHSDETKKKIAESSKKMWRVSPVKMSPNSKYACGNGTRGRSLDFNKRQDLARANNTPGFKVYNLSDNRLLGTFFNISECSRVTGEFRKTISWSLFKNKHVSKKFRFEKII
jgi:hypothetical protein